MSTGKREVPHLKDIMKLRIAMKSDPALAEKLKAALGNVCQENSLEISQDAINTLVLVHPEEVASPEAVGSLPVGSQCGF